MVKLNSNRRPKAGALGRGKVWKHKHFLLALSFLFFIGCGPQNNPSSIEESPSDNSSTETEENNQTESNANVETESNLTLTEITWFQPPKSSTWQLQLKETLNTSYDADLYDIDLFDTPIETIEQLQQEGKKVICYFSAGSYENWREDANRFPTEVRGETLDGWEDEQWLDIRNETVQTIIKSRLDLAKTKGCDGVDPDNVNAYSNNNGFDLTAEDQLTYNQFIAQEAHDRNLSVGLKNDLDQIIILEPYFDFAINEQCYAYNECETLQPFINANKAVFNVEYDKEYVTNQLGARDQICQKSIDNNIRTLILPLDLDDSFRFSCD